MTFYDRTKEDVRPWRDTQDTDAQAKDDAAVAKAGEAEDTTTAGGIRTGLGLTDVTVEEGDTVQLTPTANVTGITWESSDEAVATVNDAGLVTGVAEGTAVITATQVVKGVTSQTGTSTVIVTAAA